MGVVRQGSLFFGHRIFRKGSDVGHGGKNGLAQGVAQRHGPGLFAHGLAVHITHAFAQLMLGLNGTQCLVQNLTGDFVYTGQFLQRIRAELGIIEQNVSSGQVHGDSSFPGSETAEFTIQRKAGKSQPYGVKKDPETGRFPTLKYHPAGYRSCRSGQAAASADQFCENGLRRSHSFRRISDHRV